MEERSQAGAAALGGMDLKQVVGLLRKRASWIASSAVVGVVVSLLVTFSQDPLYKATAQLDVTGAPAQSSLVDLGGGTRAAPDNNAYETHRYMLTTNRVLDAAAAAIDLPKRLNQPGAGAGWLKRHVTVDLVPNTHILRITALAPEPQLAADIANGLATTYEKDDIDRHSETAKKDFASLSEKMVEEKDQVEKAEAALIDYVQTANLDLVDMSGASGADKNDTDLEPSGSKILGDLETQRALKKRDLEEERLDRTDEHPAVIRLKQEIAILDRQIADERARVNDENKKRIRYGILRRDAELDRELYQVLLKDLKQRDLVGDDESGRISVIESAVAPGKGSPVSPQPWVNLGLGIGAGLLFGIGLTFLQESLDRTLKSREEIERVLGLPVLGVVHRVASAKRQAALPGGKNPAPERFVLRSDGGWSPELEDFRTLRTNLRFARPEGENKTVLITSTAPQEGKTTIATNLAIVAAQAGERVLLVDADLRRPAIHLALQMENGPGLTNLLVERDDAAVASQAVRETPWPNVTVITAGAFAPNPPEILESERTKALIAQWKAKYDRIIIDSPPQSSVVDPALLAPLVDGVVLVIGSGRVDAERARLARRQLGTSGAKFYGAVLNQLTRGRDAYGYGYGYGGYGAYGYGYGSYGYGHGGGKYEYRADGNGNGNGGNGGHADEPAAPDAAKKSSRPNA